LIKEERNGMDSKNQYLQKLREEYLKATKKEKTKLLDKTKVSENYAMA